MDKFVSILIPEGSFVSSEAEGAVPKLWVQTSQGRALFKDAAQNQYYPEMRSDWTEKIANELANRLSLPAARYELAQLENLESLIPGSVSMELSNYGGEREPLEAILQRAIENYNYGSDYNISSVINILEKQNVRLPPDYSLPEGINNGADMFVGALMLDAYICNIDRHSRNFDIIIDFNEGIQYLSPIFDNGRSLGSFLQDDIKVNRSISDYSKSAQSSITVAGYKKNGLQTFEEAAKLKPQAAKIWQDRLSQINTREIQKLFDQIPEERITPISRSFSTNLLSHNQSQLLNLNLNARRNVNINLQDSYSQTLSTESSKSIIDLQFELVSSSKYIIFKENKNIFYSLDEITIEKEEQQNILVRYEGKLIKFDRDFNVIQNEFSDRELRQLNQKVQAHKQQLQQQSQKQQIDRDRGLSL